jgi:hypothetical protein
MRKRLAGFSEHDCGGRTVPPPSKYLRANFPDDVAVVPRAVFSRDAETLVACYENGAHFRADLKVCDGGHRSDVMKKSWVESNRGAQPCGEMPFRSSASRRHGCCFSNNRPFGSSGRFSVSGIRLHLPELASHVRKQPTPSSSGAQVPTVCAVDEVPGRGAYLEGRKPRWAPVHW